jgi:hypothetical protein
MFKACEKYNLKLKRKKCFFAQDSVEYLGHQIGRQGTTPGERNIEKIKNFPSDVSAYRSQVIFKLRIIKIVFHQN